MNSEQKNIVKIQHPKNQIFYEYPKWLLIKIIHMVHWFYSRNTYVKVDEFLNNNVYSKAQMTEKFRNPNIMVGD